MKIFLTPLFFLAISFTSISLNAQENTPPSPTSPSPEEKPTLTFSVYDFTENTPPNTSFFFKKGDQFIKINRQPLKFSQQYQCAFSNPFTLFEQNASTTKGTNDYSIFASTPIDQSIRKALIFLYSNNKTKSIIVTDSSLENFPLSSALLLNFSQKTIHFSIQGETYDIPPMDKTFATYSLSEKKTIRFVVTDESDKKLSVMTVDGREKQRLVILFHELENGSPRLIIERNLDTQAVLLSQ